MPLESPRALSNSLKKFFAANGIKVRVRRVNVKRAFYQIWVDYDGPAIPNYIRAAATLLEYGVRTYEGKANHFAKMDPKNITYGNTQPNRLSIDEWNIEKFFELCLILKSDPLVDDTIL